VFRDERREKKGVKIKIESFLGKRKHHKQTEKTKKNEVLDKITKKNSFEIKRSIVPYK